MGTYPYNHEWERKFQSLQKEFSKVEAELQVARETLADTLTFVTVLISNTYARLSNTQVTLEEGLARIRRLGGNDTESSDED